MKNNYKSGLVILMMAVLMISAQGVEAKYPPKTKQSHRTSYTNYNAPKMMIVNHQGHLFLFTSGTFYKRGYDEFFEVQAPIGARVKHLPRGAQQIHSPNGSLYKHKRVFYKRARRGRGYMVVRNPYSHNRNQ